MRMCRKAVKSWGEILTRGVSECVSKSSEWRRMSKMENEDNAKAQNDHDVEVYHMAMNGFDIITPHGLCVVLENGATFANRRKKRCRNFEKSKRK